MEQHNSLVLKLPKTFTMTPPLGGRRRIDVDTPAAAPVALSGGAVAPPVPEWAVATTRPGRFYFAAKRAVDIVGALVGLILLAPLYLAVALLVALDSGAPVFHRRRVLARQDYDGGVPESFDAFKFRTMRTDADELLRRDPELMRRFQKDFKLQEDPRVTRFGGKLRRTSIDELPQLWNVLVGQMTLVGPRMISPPELAMYGEHGAKLLSVKPGLTGLWQVSGRQHISYPERVRLDMWYIDNRSLTLDLEILVRTVGCVLTGRGAC